MKHLDDKIKNMAKSEETNVPEGFSERVDSLLEKLTEKPIKHGTSNNLKPMRKIRKISSLVAAAALMVVLMPAVMAITSPRVVNMAEGAISYFSAPKEFRYLSKQAEYEKYNAEVGISTSDQGINITLDNIAVDDNYINVFYTLVSEDPIQLLGDAGEPEKWRLGWAAVHFWFKADGRYIEPAAQGETDAYLVDPYTMKGMQRFALLDQLKDNFDLEMYTNWIGNIEGQWHIAVNVDKSSVAVASNTVMPNQKAKVTSGWGENTASHNITVKKVSLSPFGNQIVLSERGDNIFYNFALRDDKGEYLPVIPAGIRSRNILKTDNSFEFIARSQGLKSVTLIPIMEDGQSELQFMDLQTLSAKLAAKEPVKLAKNKLGGYVLESLQMDTEKMVAVLHQEGAVPVMDPELIPSDAKGELLDFTRYCDPEYDRETGAITLTYYWGEEVTPKDLEEIKGLSYWANYDFQLNEEEAITIELN